MPRLRRFLHLERARSGGTDGAASAPAAAERFEGVARPGPSPAAPGGSGASLERFGPEPDPAIELVEAGEGTRPFTRCMRCGMDHNVFATECGGCGASLDTAAQREFNERLWERRREEAAREAALAAERREVDAAAQAELAAARRRLGEELAREVGRSERRRLGGFGEDLGLPGGGRLGRLLRFLGRLLDG